jgi:hypothetical protein
VGFDGLDVAVDEINTVGAVGVASEPTVCMKLTPTGNRSRAIVVRACGWIAARAPRSVPAASSTSS